MRIIQLVKREVVAVPPTATIAEVAKKMQELDVEVIPIYENGRVLGIIYDRDIVTKIVANGIEPQNCRAGLLVVPSSKLLTVPAETALIDAAKLMSEKRLDFLCVADGDELVGVVAMHDITRAAEKMVQGLEESPWQAQESQTTDSSIPA